MKKKIKRLSTCFKNFNTFILELKFKISKIISIAKKLFIGVSVYLAVFAVTMLLSSDIGINTRQQSSVINVLTDTNIDNISMTTESITDQTRAAPETIVEEKIADSSHVIFSDEPSTMYTLSETQIITGPELDKYAKYIDITPGTEINVLGFNEYNVAKIFYENEELYIDTLALTSNKDYVFETVDGVVYAKNNISVYEKFEDEAGAISIAAGQKLHLTGTNSSSYCRIKLDGKTYYAINTNVSDSINYIFEEENKTIYAKGTVPIVETQDEGANVLKEITSGETITIIGNNESDFYKVNQNDTIGYVLKSRVTDNKSDLYPFLTLSSHSNIRYNEENAQNGVIATVDPSQQTEENVYLLAQLLECEAGGEGYDGLRAVATVVVNRAFDGVMGNTISSVIYRPGQFSPVSSGKMQNTTPSDTAVEAARDVLINGYRSFPAYVLYFQSIRDSYFSGQSTYLISYTDAGTWPQYFSFKWSDFNHYTN